MSTRTIIAAIIVCCMVAPVAQAQFDPTDPEPIFGGTRYEIPFTLLPQAGGGGFGIQAREGDLTKLGELQIAARDPSQNDGTGIVESINHQPLIHIKVRVIEVDRRDTLSVASVLDYFSSEGAATSLTDGFPLNTTVDPAAPPGRERLGGLTNFVIPSILSDSANGSGALVNLTARHINWVASLLATELNADVINAPQVTTLNGKNVTFRSGSKVAFNLGSNVIQPSASTIQQFVYRHVGLYISVTPQIVNWGELHEGRGTVRANYATEQRLEKLPVQAHDITNLQTCLVNLQRNGGLRNQVMQLNEEFYEQMLLNPVSGPFTEEDRTETVNVLNGLLADDNMDRIQLSSLLGNSVAIPQPSECAACDWKASDCTVNLNIAVRLSDASNFRPDGAAEAEDDVRAIANVVQVKSGHGVVMGGLISMRDVEVASKVPVLGDIPLVGAAFRSKDNVWQKTETIIFVEAEVLPPLDFPENTGIDTARSITSQDYCNGQIHLQCDLCDGVLSYGMHRAGLAGDYLPPPSHGEVEYWRQYHQAIRHKRHHTITTQLIDTFE